MCIKVYINYDYISLITWPFHKLNKCISASSLDSRHLGMLNSMGVASGRDRDRWSHVFLDSEGVHVHLSVISIWFYDNLLKHTS